MHEELTEFSVSYMKKIESEHEPGMTCRMSLEMSESKRPLPLIG